MFIRRIFSSSWPPASSCYRREPSPAAPGRIIPWNGPGSNPDFKIISWANRSFWTPRVAWNSHRNEYFVVWNAFDTTVGFPPGIPSDIAGYRISAGGVVQDPGFPLILTTYASPHEVDMVYNLAMDEYFLAFVVVHTQATTGNDIYGLRVSWNGTPVNPPGLIHIWETAKDQNAPAVATNGRDRYMVVWENEISAVDHDIYHREYLANGNPYDVGWAIAALIDDTRAPDIAAYGANDEWLAVWQTTLSGGTGYAIQGARWGFAVWFLDFEVANYAFWENENPAVAAGAPGYLIVYEGDAASTNCNIYGRMIWPLAIYLPLISRH